MKIPEDWIKTIPVFQDMNPSELDSLKRIGLLKNYGRNQSVFSEGEDAKGFFIVLKGRVKIYKLSAEGKEQILHIFSSGEPFGEVAVFENRPYPAYADAIDDLQVVFFPKTRFLQLIRSNPEIAIKWLAVLSRRLHHFTQLIDDLSLKEVPARLARYILHQTERKESGGFLRLEISKSQLASLLGTIPETLSRAISKMADEGLIQSEGSVLKILDREKLEDLSFGGKLS